MHFAPILALVVAAFHSGAPMPPIDSIPAEYRIVEEESVLAVVTHKAGLASGLAHNHFVVATDYTSTVDFRPDDLLRSRMQATVQVAGLEIDGMESRERWYPRLDALGILSDPFRSMSEDDREKVRGEMLDEGQLDAENFPEIGVRVGSITETPSTLGEVEFPYELLVEFTIRGEAVFRQVAARIVSEEEGAVVIEAAGMFYFTDFGIEPYSAFLGSVKNENGFHVYLHLTAEAVGGGNPGET